MSEKQKSLTDIINDTSSSSTKSGTDSFDIDELNWEKQFKLKQLSRYQSNTDSRKWLAKWAAWVVSVWLFFVLTLLFLNNKINIKLSDTVLSALLVTTTLNVLGLMFIVLKGYFSGDEKVD